MKIETAFDICVVKDTIKRWSKHKEEILSLIKDIPFVPTEGYYSDFYVEGKKVYADRLFEILLPTMRKFESEVKRPFTVTGLWAQKYLKGGASHQCHNHGALGYSAVFYASLGKLDKGTRFICPFSDVNGGHTEYIPDVKEGDIIFFPSFLMHQSTMTIDNSERIIFSFNMKFT